MVTTADVAIIGSGVIGASTALELSRSGLKVVVIDKAGGPGHGSTSASSAVVRFNYSTWDGIAASWESKFRWQQWEDYLGYRDPAGLARFNQCGIVVLDVDVAPRDAVLPLFDKAGIPYEEWDAATLMARIPGIDAGSYFPPKPVTSDAFFEDAVGELGGIYTPDAGYVDDPQLAAANLAAAAAYNGATFLYRRRVTGLSRKLASWVVEVDNAPEVEAPIVVNAAGPWSGALNKMCEADGDFTVSVRPMRQEVHHVAAPENIGARDMPVIADLDLGTYIRPESGGNLLVGGTEPACDALEWVDDPETADPRVTLGRFEAQVTRAARRLPDLGVPNRPKGIAGVYGVTPDWTPIYDKTALPGFYVAIGTSGNQFKNAPVVGALMETIIRGVESGRDHDLHPLTYDCPHTGHVIDLGSFSRRREINAESTGTVMG